MDAKPKCLVIGRGPVGPNLMAGNMGETPYELDTSIHKVPKGKQYDYVLVWNRLEYEPIKRLSKYVESISNAVKPGGVCHLYCIAAEWVAECIVTHKPSKMWRGVLFGEQRDDRSYAKNILTMRDLRTVVEQAGLHGIDAQTGHFVMKDEKTEQKVRVACHYVVGWKPLPEDDKSDIINPDIN